VAEGIVIDVRPITAPALMNLVSLGDYRGGHRRVRHDRGRAAADARSGMLISRLSFSSGVALDFEVYYDSAEDLKTFVETSKRMRESRIPYQELEERRSELGAATGQPSRLRCHRPWIMSVYRKTSPH
jgi:hypothetical protein